MAYPERKPIYDAYESIIKNIVESKIYKSYAESELDALDASIFSSLKSIRNKVVFGKEWPPEG
jgi:hypothetical protein